MKVIHLIGGGDIGGAKTHVLHLVRELGKSIDVKMVTFLPGIFTDEARRMGINVDMYRKGFFWINIFRVARHIKKEKYDLIHSHGAKGNTAAVICKFLTGIPVVTTIHSDYRLDYMNNVWKKYTNGLLNTMALRFIDKYVAVSRNFNEMMVKRGFDKNSVFTLYNGIEFPSDDVKVAGRTATETTTAAATGEGTNGRLAATAAAAAETTTAETATAAETTTAETAAPEQKRSVGKGREKPVGIKSTKEVISFGDMSGSCFDLGKPLIGFSLRKWKRDVDVAGIFAEVGDLVCSKLGAGVVLFPLHYSKDLDLAEEIAGKMKARPLIMRGHYTPSQLAGFYGLMDINVCIRFHGLVFSLSNNVPVVAVSYDPKIDSLMDYMGNRIIRYRELNAKAVFDEINAKWERREELSAEIAVKTEEFRVLARLGINEVLKVIKSLRHDSTEKPGEEDDGANKEGIAKEGSLTDEAGVEREDGKYGSKVEEKADCKVENGS